MPTLVFDNFGESQAFASSRDIADPLGGTITAGDWIFFTQDFASDSGDGLQVQHTMGEPTSPAAGRFTTFPDAATAEQWLESNGFEEVK
jgi:hypothetical protein